MSGRLPRTVCKASNLTPTWWQTRAGNARNDPDMYWSESRPFSPNANLFVTSLQRGIKPPRCTPATAHGRTLNRAVPRCRVATAAGLSPGCL